ncbi:MAG: hypothetical protein GX601_06830 [Anaerolineales bacterium]|nr:hypothetical protein [Anaerolineales bacterium]
MQLEAAGPTDDALLVNFRSWPGGGNYPTTAWQPGEAVVDRYRLQLPGDVSELQLWNLNLIFLDPQPQPGDGGRLPVRINGATEGSHVTLARLRVEPDSDPSPPEDAVYSAPFAFGAEREIVLEGALIDGDEREVQVALWWRVRQPLGGAYTVFVHLLDAEGQLVAAGDGPPRAGAMPTDYWRAGDVIVDRHRIPLAAPLPSGTYYVGVGFYDAVQRLPAWDGEGQALQNSTAIVGEWR